MSNPNIPTEASLPEDYVPLKDRGALPPELAAAYIGLAPRTLANRRSEGIADPPFVRVGRSITYRVEDLDDYLLRHRVGGSK